MVRGRRRVQDVAVGHAPAPRSTEVIGSARRLLSIAAIVCAIATAIGVIALWPDGTPAGALQGTASLGPVSGATVRGVREGPCAGSPDATSPSCLLVSIEIVSGTDTGVEAELEFPADAPQATFASGDRITVARVQAEGPPRYAYVDRDRTAVLIALSVLFAVAVIALGRVRGVMALVGLISSVVVILRFILPAILGGKSPLAVAIVGCSSIAFLALYLAHGLRPLTTVALLGTLASLGITLLLSELFTNLAQFSGFSGEESFLLNLGAGQVDLRGLVLAGVIIGALGAIDDMTVTQASTVWELHGADPTMPSRHLFRAAMRVGRDHVASTVNTLFLAYVGASLPLLLLFVLTDRTFASVANGEVVAIEIVRTLVGSIGLVASVPITTALAAAALGRVRAGSGGRPLDPGPKDEETDGPADKLWLPERRRDLWKRR
jgi:uncharacterized membrane protein